ncbi:MAG: CBS domain-containing protein [Symploca sp. SIO2C1]|nr:CBS domain-containing protein [Symploca sp. SIO2C1]
MQLNEPLIRAPALEEAIDSEPLIVAPNTLLVEVIALISQALGSSCSLPSFDSPSDSIPIIGARSSCVLVMEDHQLLGIFTERDIVRLTADGMNFSGVKIAEVMVKEVITLPQSAVQDIFAALFLFRRYRIRHLPIVDDCSKLVGIVSPDSIRQVLRPANLLKLRRVSEVMSHQVVHAPLTASVLSLAQLMTKKRVSCVVITEEDEEKRLLPVGIVTERDIVQFQSLQLNLAKTQAQVVMSTPLFLLSPQDSLWTAHQEMQQRRVRRLVVSWNWGQRLGIVTQTSLLRVFDPMEMYGIVETLQQTIQQLEAERSQNSNAQLEQQNSARVVKLQEQLEAKCLDAPPQIKAISSTHNQLTDTTAQQLQTLLSTIQIALESLLQEPNLSPELQQSRLNAALAEVEQMRNLVEGRRQEAGGRRETSL